MLSIALLVTNIMLSIALLVINIVNSKIHKKNVGAIAGPAESQAVGVQRKTVVQHGPTYLVYSMSKGTSAMGVLHEHAAHQHGAQQ